MRRPKPRRDLLLLLGMAPILFLMLLLFGEKRSGYWHPIDLFV